MYVPVTDGQGGFLALTRLDKDDAERLSPCALRLNNGYAIRWDKGQRIYLHRELLGLPVGDKRQGDHINRDKLDNRRENLRIVTAAENGQNQSSHRGSTSRFRGVSLHPRTGRWYAICDHKGHRAYLGLFAVEIDAAVAAETYRLTNVPFAVPDPELAGLMEEAA